MRAALISRYSQADMLRMAAVAVLYLGLAIMAMRYGIAAGNASVFWPATGLALCAALLVGYHVWPAIFIGAYAASLWIGNPWWVGLPIAAGNTLDAAVGAWLLQRARFNIELPRLRDFYKLCLLGSMAVLSSTLLGPSALWLAGYFALEQWPWVALHWWMGSALGVTLFAPLLLVWRRIPMPLLADWRRIAEGMLLLALFVYCGGVVLAGWHSTLPLSPYAMAFWVIPFFVWTALRFGRHGMTVLLLLQFLLSLVGVSNQAGVFGNDFQATGLLNFWFYHLVYCVAGMTVSQVLRELQEAMLGLRRSAYVFEHSNQGIMITDAELRIVSVNQAFTRITGYTLAESLGKKPDMLSSGTHGPEFYEELWEKVRSAGTWSGEIWNRRKDGSLYVEWLDICTVKSPQTGRIENYIGLFMDITDRKADEQNILHQAQHDFLTGLPNRLLFTDRFSQAQAVAQREHARFVLMYLDLDGFKQINDRYGHHVGDLLLKEIAARLGDTLRATDTVCRLGGDEFVILVPGLEDEAHLNALSEKILGALSAPYHIDQREIRSFASIGYAFYPDHGKELETLLHAADQAMYLAKQAGGNRLARPPATSAPAR